MAPNSCTVAVEIDEHHITIHFKSDDELRRIYVHPDNIVFMSGTRSWSKRSGKEYTLCQNKHQARASLENLCQALKKERESWKSLRTDNIMMMIYEEIGVSSPLWKKLVKAAVTGLVVLGTVVTKAITTRSSWGLIGWWYMLVCMPCLFLLYQHSSLVGGPSQAWQANSHDPGKCHCLK